jgi:hypothetical protein
MADTTIAANLRANLATVRRFHRQPRQSHEEDKQEAFLLPSSFYRRPRSRRVNTTPRCGVPPEGGCGPLGTQRRPAWTQGFSLAFRAARHRSLADLRC